MAAELCLHLQNKRSTICFWQISIQYLLFPAKKIRKKLMKNILTIVFFKKNVLEFLCTLHKLFNIKILLKKFHHHSRTNT